MRVGKAGFRREEAASKTTVHRADFGRAANQPRNDSANDSDAAGRDNGARGKVALVTGCAGFLGSHLTDCLIFEGWHVVGVDNLLTGSVDNLEFALASGRFEFLEQDVIEPIEVGADLIFNLACPASPPRYQADPLHTMRTNINGAFNVCDIAKRCGSRLVHTSTSEVYGDPEIHPQPEDYRGAVNPIGPRACYDEGKRAAETILFDYQRQFGTNIGVCRLFNSYGPRMDPYDGRVVSNFLRQALMGEPLTIYGDGSQTRSFCYVDDTVEGIFRLAMAPSSVCGPINLGNPIELTMIELAEEVRGLLGSQVDIVFQPLPTDDPTRRRPDIELAGRELDWAPTVSLKVGLARTLEYFEGLLASGRLAAEAHLGRAAAE